MSSGNEQFGPIREPQFDRQLESCYPTAYCFLLGMCVGACGMRQTVIAEGSTATDAFGLDPGAKEMMCADIIHRPLSSLALAYCRNATPVG